MTDYTDFHSLIVTELIEPLRPYELARNLREDMFDVTKALRLLTDLGLVTSDASGRYSLTQPGLDLARDSIVAAASVVMDPKRHAQAMERRKQQLVHQMAILTDPDAARESIVAAFYEDPDVERMGLTQDLLDWCSENEAILASYDPSAPPPPTRVTLRNGSSVLVASTFYMATPEPPYQPPARKTLVSSAGNKPLRADGKPYVRMGFSTRAELRERGVI